eukprot:TRINITY_DN2874_c1_g1_i3.p1 TRINITY_DN2874_c1_g1~~TRINITY_DN2874_c1_g1_i3.p1  ORF type:complete len:327 (-),score=33.70 TRINITY_DN2874_c1_g1_i3:37-1017(-)
MLMLGYLETDRKIRNSSLQQKRQRYMDLVRENWRPDSQDFEDHTHAKVKHVPNQFPTRINSLEKFSSRPIPEMTTDAKSKLYHLVSIDVARTHPDNFDQLFDFTLIKLSLERILFVWSVENRHISYFQGLNDLASLFFIVSLTSCFGHLTDDTERAKDKKFEDYLSIYLPAIEADTYWCISELMQTLVSQHPIASGGVHAESMMSIFRIYSEQLEPELISHLDKVGIEFAHFSFRWMLCLMTREFSTGNSIKLWDTYIIKHPNGFTQFHIFVCIALLIELRPLLMETDDLGKCMYILQKPPTIYWDESNLSVLIKKASEISQKLSH